MRIAIVQTPYADLNLTLPAGMERVALEELRFLTAIGHKVTIYANNVVGDQPHVINLSRMKKISRLKELVFLLAFLGRNFRGKVFIGFYAPLLALLAPKRTFIFFQGEAIFALPLERYQWACRRYNKSHYLFCSDYVRGRFIDQHPLIDRNRLFRLHSGVNVQDFQPIENPRRSGPVRFSFHGRWVEDKGILILLEAVKILEAKRNDFECVLAGSPEIPYPTPESIKVGEKVKGIVKNMKTVKLAGAIAYNELPTFIRNMEFGIVPSIYPEPFGIVNLEYMACGLPVIATKVGGIPEIVLEGKTGLLVQPNNPQELAAAIERFLDSPDLRIKMGKLARERVEVNFTWEVHGRRLSSLCRNAKNISV